MKKTLLYIIILSLTSCASVERAQRSSGWAVADMSTIFKGIKNVAIYQNPIPEKFIYDKNKLNIDIGENNSKIIQEERLANIKCIIDDERRELELSYFYGNVPHRRYTPGSNPAPVFDGQCFKEIENSSPLKEFKSDKERLLGIRDYQNKYQSIIELASTEMAYKIVSKYAKAKYGLVVDEDIEKIFNESGTTIDITDGILSIVNSDGFMVDVDL